MGYFNQAIAILAAILNFKMDPRFENYIIIHHTHEWMPRVHQEITYKSEKKEKNDKILPI